MLGHCSLREAPWRAGSQNNELLRMPQFQKIAAEDQEWQVQSTLLSKQSRKDD